MSLKSLLKKFKKRLTCRLVRTLCASDGEMRHLAEQIKVKEQVLNDQRREYRQLFESVPCLITVQNESLELVQFNREFEEHFRPRVGDRCYQAYKNRTEPCDNCPVMETFRDGKPHASEQSGVTNTGETCYWTLRTAPITGADGKVKQVMEIAVDITEQILAEQQLVQAGKMATLGEMATGVAHELNQPLSVIKSASNYIMRKVKAGESIPGEIMMTMTEEIDGQVSRAEKIINHMREFGRKSDNIKEKADVNRALLKALDIFKEQLMLHQIGVVQHLDHDLPMIPADENRLEQVFINLLLNARDAIEERFEHQDQSAESDKQIFLTTRVSDKWVIIEIEDTGTGISPGIADKIFDPFFTTKAAGKGTGLGLSIGYRIIKDYGGTITLDKERLTGALFTIRFPFISHTNL
nr:ATP-binding protein [uncultured Desulfobacter sp.]